MESRWRIPRPHFEGSPHSYVDDGRMRGGLRYELLNRHHISVWLSDRIAFRYYLLEMRCSSRDSVIHREIGADAWEYDFWRGDLRYFCALWLVSSDSGSTPYDTPISSRVRANAEPFLLRCPSSGVLGGIA